MKILITGGTGFIGRELCLTLTEKQHDLTLLTRETSSTPPNVKVVHDLLELQSTDHFDSVINLAGEPIADKRWTPKQKAAITDSRIQTTQQLVNYMAQATHKPTVFVSGSAIGFYGVDISAAPVDEHGAADDSFSSVLCQAWEAQALAAEALGIRTCLLRTGIVLGNGGALGKMLLPFKMGVGGKIGTGEQFMPWIHIRDMVRIIEACVSNAALSGPINCTAPKPESNEQFTKTLGSALGRPTILPMPAFAIKVLMGEMGEELLLAGKCVIPAKLQSSDFTFQFETLEAALRDIV